jgi:hypothetical protein
MVRSGSAGELEDEPKYHNAGDPDQAEDDRDAIEVTFGDPGGAEVRGDSTAEHVGQAATATAVEQDEQGQQKAHEPENDLQYNLKNCHD